MLLNQLPRRLAHEIVDKRYPTKEGEVHQDMLGSFIRHGLTKEEAESESVMQLYVLIQLLMVMC